MPRLLAAAALRRYAKRLPEQRWRSHALACTLGAAASRADRPRPTLQRLRLTPAPIATLQLENRGSLARALQVASMISLGAALALIYLGQLVEPTGDGRHHTAVDRPQRKQAQHYGLFVVQVGISFVLLAESLAPTGTRPRGAC